MKKLLTLSLIVLFTFLLVACQNEPTVPIETPTDTDDPTLPTQTIELTYADWGDQELNQMMIDAFMEKYPHIRVTLRSDIAGSGATFTGNLITAAQAGLLPDVFAIDNVPIGINAGLALDVAPYYDADPDSALVYDNIALAGVYNGKRLAMPSFQFFKGILINLSVFEAKDLTTVPGKYRVDINGYPTKDWTYSEFIEIAKAVKNYDLQNPQDLMIGFGTWFGAPDFQQVWPTMNDADVQYDTWDGTQFNYTSPDWIYAMQRKVELFTAQDGTTTHLNPEDVENYPELQGYLIMTGRAAMQIEGSWNLWVINSVKAELDQKIGFWPYPQGTEGLFPPTILDFQMVSSQTQHPEEAYLLAKWMTFGQEGWETRLSILEERKAQAEALGEIPLFLDRYPVAEYPGIWDRVYDLVDGIEGIEYIIDRIQYSKPDLDKWLPGYNSFWAWVFDQENNPYCWQNLIVAGPTAVAEYAAQWESKANEIVQAELARMGSD